LTDTGGTLRANLLHIPGCIRHAAGLCDKKAKQLLTGIAAVRNSPESYNSTDKASLSADYMNDPRLCQCPELCTVLNN
jgi:hypothetical protein